MNDNFVKMQSQLARAVVWLLYMALATLGLALIAALLGLPNAVAGFRQVSATLGAVFLGLFLLTLLGHLTAAVVRRLNTNA